MKFLHLTDLHMVKSGLLYDLDPAERLGACVADINARHSDAAFAVVTGDLTQWGDEAAYLRVRALLAGLRMPVHLLLGNHDNRAVFRQVFPEAPGDAAGFVQHGFDTGIGRFICLDTNTPAGHHGELDAPRLDWLRAELDAAGSRDVYLFMHHPPLDVGIKGMDRIVLRERDALAGVLAGRNVRHLFFGHLHRPLAGLWQGIPFMGLPGMNHQVALDLTLEGNVPGSHEPPAYGVVLAQGGEMVAHIHHFLDRTNTFVL